MVLLLRFQFLARVGAYSLMVDEAISFYPRFFLILRMDGEVLLEFLLAVLDLPAALVVHLKNVLLIGCEGNLNVNIMELLFGLYRLIKTKGIYGSS